MDVIRVGTLFNSNQGGACTPQRVSLQTYVQRSTDMQTDISYCIDANYWKGTTLENSMKKHRRQLVVEIWDG